MACDGNGGLRVREGRMSVNGEEGGGKREQTGRKDEGMEWG